jgi:hypothetical protein
MPRTHTNYRQDTPFNDLLLWCGTDMWQSTGGAVTLTRSAPGVYYFAQAASLTVNFFLPLSTLLQRTGYFPKSVLQEQFGAAVGPEDVRGFPPFTGASELTPVTAPWPKGIEINDVTLVYGITGAALTSQTPSLESTLFANNAAPVATSVPLTGALATATQTQPYVTKMTVNSPAFTVADLTGLFFDLVVVTAASGAYNLYGAFVHATFNFN